MTLQNPMDLSGPPTNYQQPNTANPAANANVANFPVGANVLDVSKPVPAYVQPGTGNPAPEPD
jgi:hypothetical protein